MMRRAPFLPSMAILALTAIPATVAAAERAIGREDGEPRMVSALRANGARVVELGARGGLDGYLVEPAAGDPYSLYLTPGGHAVAGLLYGPDGNLITGDQIAAAQGGDAGGRRFGLSGSDGGEAVLTAHAAEAVAAGPGAEAPFERSASAFGFTLGESGPLVVLFGDPACRWSRSAAARLGNRALAGRFRLHVVPVGLLGGAAARNNALFDAWGGTAAPLIAWRGAQGRIERRIGEIGDLDAWLRELPR